MSKKSPAPTYMFVFRNATNLPDPTPEQMQVVFGKWMAWIEGIKKKGQHIAGDPLEDRPGKVLRGLRGAKVTDGPFAEAKEVVGGYLLVKAKSFAAAAKLATGCPGLAFGGSVEVRQIMPMHD